MSKKNQSYTLGTLFGLGKALGLSPNESKEMAYGLIGKNSLTQFSQAEINEVCYEMMIRKDGAEGQRSSSRASDAQLYRIREYERLLGWAEEPQRLEEFVRKRFGAAAVAWLTPVQASKVIEGLKKMHQRKGATG